MLSSIRSIRRLILIAITFARHGALAPFEHAMVGAGLAPVVLFVIQLLFGRQVGDKRPGERLALALSELGPAFIKLGQVLSTRSDLLGEQVAGDRGSYQYLVESIRKFPNQETLAGMMAKAGFAQVSYRNLSAGIAALHSGWRV